MPKLSAHVHRFGDTVAVSAGTGDTCYIDPKTARKLARAIMRAAQSVEREKYGQSPGGLTVSLDLGEQGPYSGNPRYDTLPRDEAGRLARGAA